MLPFAIDTYRYYRLARHALHAGLKLLDVGPGQKVLIPEFICRDLLAAIYAVGATPAYYAVDQALRPTVLPSAEQSVRAVLAVNYFGFPQDLAPFRLYCEQYGAALIEDNAHGFLSSDACGNALGSRGDLGIFSMRKTLAWPDGGALMVNRSDWLPRLPVQLDCRHEPLPASYRVKRAIARIERATGAPAKAFGQDIARGLRWLRTGHAIPPPEPESEYKMPFSPAPHCYMVAALQRLDVAAESARRRKLYEAVREQLAGVRLRPIFGDLAHGVVPYGYPFYADDETARLVCKIARRLSLDCIRWPDLPEAVIPCAPPHYRSAWLVNFLC